MVEKELDRIVDNYAAATTPRSGPSNDMVEELRTIFPIPPHLEAAALEMLSGDEIAEAVQDHAMQLYGQREEAVGQGRCAS